MTKAEYMNRLQEKLESFSRELQEDIMEDYRQHFAEGELQGKTDEEIIQELGTIEDMIQDLPESDLKENIGSQLSNMTRMSPSLSHYVSDFVSENGETDHGRKNAEDKAKKEFCYSGAYNAMVLEGNEADIFLEKSKDDQIHVEYVNQSYHSATEYEYYQYEENGIFYAGVRHRKDTEGRAHAKEKDKSWKITFFGETIISYGNRNSIQNKISLSLSVKVPAHIQNLRVRAASGDIQLAHLVQNELLLESASGDIKASETNTHNLRLQASSGDISLSDITCREKLDIHTRSGDLSLKRAAADLLEIKAFSGDISIHELKCRQAQTEVSSGDVDIAGITAESLNIHSASGDISIVSAASSLLNAESASGDITVSGVNSKTGSFTSSQGDISVTNSQLETGKIVTKNGDIAIRSTVRVCERTPHVGDISVNTPGESGKISLRSASGDISLNTSGTPESVILQSDNGDIHLNMSKTQGIEVNADTGWGDSEIWWEGERRTLKKGIHTYGNGASKVTVRSKRGDIRVAGSRP